MEVKSCREAHISLLNECKLRQIRRGKTKKDFAGSIKETSHFVSFVSNSFFPPLIRLSAALKAAFTE